MKKRSFLLSFLILCFIFSQNVFAFDKAAPETDQLRVERLAGLCRIWGRIKYFHPALAYRTDIDWDAALVKAVPKVREAQTREAYAAAVRGMLDALGDPLIRVVDTRRKDAEENNGDDQFKYRSVDDGILVITAGNYFELWGQPAQEKLRAATAEALKAKAIVFDLRSASSVGDYGQMQLASTFEPFERLISTTPSLTRGERRRVHHGFEGGFAISSGQYKSGFYTQDVKRITPAANAKNIPSVFLLNKNSGLLESIPVLQAAGKALVVFEGENSDSAIGKSETVDIGEGLSVSVRVAETVLEDGTSGDIRPDKIVPGAGKNTDAALEAALDLARNFKPSITVREKLPSIAAPPKDKSYPDMKYPGLEYRLLAAFRAWNTIEFFYPHKNLMERDWADVLREFIPRFEGAKDGLEYSLTVAEMMTHIHDSHAYVSGSVINDHFGTFYPPIRVRMIENTLLVTAFTDEKAARAGGVAIGDTILKVDGEDAKKRFERYARYISASTSQSNTDKATLAFMNGKDASPVTLTIRDRSGKAKKIRLPRKFEDYNTLYHRERTGDIIRSISADIGYADLDRLTPEMIDEMLDRFKNARAIIFDMRGYPNSIFWILPQRLTEKLNVPAARLETRFAGESFGVDGWGSVFQNIFPPTPGNSIYKGRTVMLIDERSMSQAEHTGMFLRAANGTRFIGSHTSGANGEITTFSLPGGIGVGFTGQSVRFPDGRQLQRIGLTPDVEVKPTVKGIQAGRDEVLESAVQYLNREFRKKKNPVLRNKRAGDTK
jgi:C-terminal processing protease CtpA/Prc